MIAYKLSRYMIDVKNCHPCFKTLATSAKVLLTSLALMLINSTSSSVLIMIICW